MSKIFNVWISIKHLFGIHTWEMFDAVTDKLRHYRYCEKCDRLEVEVQYPGPYPYVRHSMSGFPYTGSPYYWEIEVNWDDRKTKDEVLRLKPPKGFIRVN